MKKKNRARCSVTKLPCKRKLPDFYHSQSSNDTFYQNHPKKFYRQLYFDSYTNYGVNEFDVPSLKTQLLLFTEIAKLMVSTVKCSFQK